MAKTYRTPGVYVQEISTLPGTVAEVQSAIPAFIGYTQKIRYDGRALQGIPERIASLKDFEERFGKGSDVYLKNINITTNSKKLFSQVDSVSFSKRFLLYESIYMYFINGGGECYVVSIGSFAENGTKPTYDAEPFKDAIDSLNMVDEITLIVMPEAVLLGDSMYSVQQKVLDHCSIRMNRFAILDIKEEVSVPNGKQSILLNWKNTPEPDYWVQSYKEFRDMIGVMNLSYGAAYTPYIIGDTPANCGYKDIKECLFDSADSKDEKTNLLLADLDPSAHGAVTYLDNAIQDQNNLLSAINITKQKLIGNMKDKPQGFTAEKATPSEAILQSYTNEKNPMSIAKIGEVLSDLLYSLAPSSVDTTKDLVSDTLVNAFMQGVKSLREATTALLEANAEDFVNKKDTALQMVDTCLKATEGIKTNTGVAMIEVIQEIQLAINDLFQKEDEQYTEEKQIGSEKAITDKLVILESTSNFNESPRVSTTDVPVFPLSEDIVQHIKDKFARVIPQIEALCAPNTKATGTDTLAKFSSIVGKVTADNMPSFAKLLGNILVDDIHDTIMTNVERLSDGLFGTSPVYRCIHAALQKALRVQPSSASMAGLYAATDNTRGVWKAPANISISNCIGLTQTITAKAQEELNIDSVAGKSINALRSFPGKGFLVWGARTLDGNSQEWRYIPVRRFFIMVEESVRRATSASVFEPNDANLWVKVKSLIDNYLLQKWKDGALMGASAAESYFVNIGLGSTMTEQDVLDGRLIVDIGMAVVRPAEFIILRFMHKMQQ